MSFENLKASIALLLEQMTEQPHNAHEAQEALREKLSELRALGQPVPQDLVDLEEELTRELTRKRPAT